MNRLQTNRQFKTTCTHLLYLPVNLMPLVDNDIARKLLSWWMSSVMLGESKQKAIWISSLLNSMCTPCMWLSAQHTCTNRHTWEFLCSFEASSNALQRVVLCTCKCYSCACAPFFVEYVPVNSSVPQFTHHCISQSCLFTHALSVPSVTS